MLRHSLWSLGSGLLKQYKNVSYNIKITLDEIDTGGGVKGNIWL